MLDGFCGKAMKKARRPVRPFPVTFKGRSARLSGRASKGGRSTLLMTLRNAHRHAAMMSGRGLFIASHLGSSGDRRTGQTAFWQCTKTIGI
jgi:hypothetical protein